MVGRDPYRGWAGDFLHVPPDSASAELPVSIGWIEVSARRSVGGLGDRLWRSGVPSSRTRRRLVCTLLISMLELCSGRTDDG